MATIAQTIAQTTAAYNRCMESGNAAWGDRWDAYLDALESELPSGSGIDSGTKIDRDPERTNDGEAFLTSSYHVMDDNGMYAGWIDFTVTVTPDWDGINVGVNLNKRDIDSINESYLPEDSDDEDFWSVDADSISDYLTDVYSEALSAEAPTLAEILAV